MQLVWFGAHYVDWASFDLAAILHLLFHKGHCRHYIFNPNIKFLGETCHCLCLWQKKKLSVSGFSFQKPYRNDLFHCPTKYQMPAFPKHIGRVQLSEFEFQKVFLVEISWLHIEHASPNTLGDKTINIYYIFEFFLKTVTLVEAAYFQKSLQMLRCQESRSSVLSLGQR